MEQVLDQIVGALNDPHPCPLPHRARVKKIIVTQNELSESRGNRSKGGFDRKKNHN
jgi:hypothetical protein